MARSKSPNGPLDVEMTPEHEAALEWVRLNPGSRHEVADGTPIGSIAGLTGEQYVW